MILHPLARRQLGQAFAGAVPDLPGLRAFATAVSEAYIAADDERRQLAVILDNVAQGFATVALDGSIGRVCSRAFTAWFGEVDDTTRIWSHLASHDPNLEAWIELGFHSLQEGIMPTEVVIGQLPPWLDRDGRRLHVEYQPIGQPIAGFVIVVSDVTEELEREKTEAAERELITVVENAYRDRTGFLAFMRETQDLLRHARPPELPLDKLQREIHTLKGSAAMFGVLSVSQICHELESQIEREAAPPDDGAWRQLTSAWRAFHDRVDHLLGLSERRAVLVDWDEYQSVLASLDDPERSWAARIRGWGQDPTRAHLEHFAEQARQLAHRLGKRELEVEVRDNGVGVDRDRFAPIWSALVHAVRNAVDHGIEPDEHRRALGKPAHGRLVITSEVRGSDVILEIADDGAGIDWRAVAARATALGLPHATQRELCEAVFASGLSTARDVTQTSGRGLGMTALRATCLELGGRVELDSEPGRGTTVRCVLPLTRARPRTRNVSFTRS
ncbi:MAG TPA: ATP-binding protein [Kofleriaceae bacterium]|nr:ATP-binding protein [Kofleriaceae bacterium]